MFVKVSYEQNSILFKNNLDNLQSLVKSFKQSAKVDESVSITFLFSHPINNSKTVILSDDDLSFVKLSSQTINKQLIVLEAINSNSDSLKDPENSFNGSEAEIIEQNEPEEFQLISDDKKVELELNQTISKQYLQDSEKSKKNKQKLKKMVQKEIQKQLPSITSAVKAQILEELQAHQQQQQKQERSKPCEQQFSHTGFICDGCEMAPIVGTRYKCISCQDYDLCQNCEENGVHSHHAFLKIRNPKLAPQMIVSVEADDQAKEMLSQTNHLGGFQNIDIDLKKILGCMNNNKHGCMKDKKKEKKQDKKEKKDRKEKQDKMNQENVDEYSTKESSEQQQQQQSIPEIVSSIVGGKPEDYVEICLVLDGFSVEEIIESCLANKEQILAEIEIQQVEETVSAQRQVQSKINTIEQVELKEELSEELILNAKLIAAIVDGSESTFTDYISLIQQNSSSSIEQLIDMIFTQKLNDFPKDMEDFPCLVGEKSFDAIFIEKPVEVVVVEKPVEVVVVEKAVEVVAEQQYPPVLKQKAEQVAEIMGGKFEDYINQILNMPCKSTVQEIIESLIASSDFQKQECEKISQSIEQQKPKRVLKQNYSEGIKKKASQLADIFGENEEQYYEFVYSYCLSNLNELIEIVISNPSILSNFSSYKD